MVSFEPLLDLPILWQSFTSLDPTWTSMSERIDVTVDSRSVSWTLSETPGITILFLLRYCSRASREVLILFNLFSSFRHLWHNFSWFCWRHLMAIYFKLMISSLTLFMYFMILSSRFWRDSLVTAEFFFALVLYLCVIIDNTAVIPPNYL